MSKHCLLGFFLACFSSCSLWAAELDVYFGTYTRGASEGIYRSTLDLKSGKLSDPVLVVQATNPSFLEINSDATRLYAVGEGGDIGVSTFSIEKDGTLRFLGGVESGGSGPCHISLSPNGKFAAVANYGGGSVSSYTIDANGVLQGPVSTIQHVGSSVDPRRQTKPHAHSINFSQDSRFAYAADLGTDRVYVYAVDSETGALVKSSEAKLPGGSGPRHFAIHPEGELAFLINEMTRDVTSFRVDSETGALERVESQSTLPPGAEAQGSTAEVVVHPSGKFVYGSNRGHDTIVAFALDEGTGMLKRIENEPIQGAIPRNFAITPDGIWLLAAGQKSNTVAVFSLDSETGELDYSDVRVEVDSPVCVRFASRQD